MAQSIEIKKYLYYLFSSREDASPVVFLYDANDAHIGFVYFRGGNQPLPKAKQYPNGKYALYYRRSVLAELIDMLRNEKPVYLHWVPEGTNNSRISTTPELVGEEETCCSTLKHYYCVNGTYEDTQDPAKNYTFTGCLLLEVNDLEVQVEEYTIGGVSSTNLGECFVSYDLSLKDSDGNTISIEDRYVKKLLLQSPDGFHDHIVETSGGVKHIKIESSIDMGLSYTAGNSGAEEFTYDFAFGGYQNAPKIQLGKNLEIIFPDAAYRYAGHVVDTDNRTAHLILQYSKMASVP